MSLILLNLSWIALWGMIKNFWINLIFLVFRPPSKAHALNVAEKWHTAYHGTRLDLVRRILDRGDLLSPGNSCWLIDGWMSIPAIGAGLTELIDRWMSIPAIGAGLTELIDRWMSIPAIGAGLTELIDRWMNIPAIGARLTELIDRWMSIPAIGAGLTELIDRWMSIPAIGAGLTELLHLYPPSCFSSLSHRCLDIPFSDNNDNNNVHLSCAHQRPERSYDS